MKDDFSRMNGSNAKNKLHDAQSPFLSGARTFANSLSQRSRVHEISRFLSVIENGAVSVVDFEAKFHHFSLTYVAFEFTVKKSFARV